ncbi:MAG: flagellar hook-basal body complex protein FliE [Longimicrobiales bacterium]
MMATSIGSVGTVQGLGGLQSAGGPGALRGPDSRWRSFGPRGEGGASFVDSLKQALGDVSALQEGAKDAIGAFLRGEPVELHEVMAATEEAGIALEMLIEIRNKITDAYRAVIGMQG